VVRTRPQPGPGRRSGVNVPQLADRNAAVALGWIRRSEVGLSRVELTAATGLSPQAISNIAQRLLDQGLIREAGKTSGGMGKPRTLLELDPAGAYAVGVHLDPAVVTVVLVDFVGTVVARSSFSTADADPPEELIARVSRAVMDVAAGSGVPRARLLGVGVASPGPIDAATGTVLDPPLMTQWHDVPVRDLLEKATGLTTLLDKDVVAAVIAERWLGHAVHSRNALFVYLGAGVGAGAIVEDAVVRGVSGNAGDIGSLTVAGADGRAAVLGDLVNPVVMLERAVAAGVFRARPPKSEPLRVDAQFTELCALAGGGNADAARVLELAADRLGDAVSGLANMLDVDTVVLGGPVWSRVAEWYLGPVAAIVRERSITRGLHRLEVRGTKLGDDAGAIGAACLVLDTVAS
jgi:predicted NBD/HSP70 family sugar kinase